MDVATRATAAVPGWLRTLPAVETLHTTSGRFDMIVTLNAESTEELDRRLDTIGEAQGVRASESLIHLTARIDRTA